MTWTGFTGSPGYTNLHFLDPNDEPSQTVLDNVTVRCRAFFEAFKGYLPLSARIDYPNALQRYDTGTGELEAELAIASQTVTAGTGTGNFSSATGACVSWSTVGIVNGRKVRGRTFIVPMSAGSYDTDGTLTSAALTAINTGATGLVAPTIDLPLAVWARPTPGGSDGAAYDVTTYKVRDRTAVLRSRRD